MRIDLLPKKSVVRDATYSKWRILTAKISSYISEEDRVYFVERFSSSEHGKTTWVWESNGPLMSFLNVTILGSIAPRQSNMRFPEEFIGNPAFQNELESYYELIGEAFHGNLHEIMHYISLKPLLLLSLLRIPSTRLSNAEFDEYKDLLEDLVYTRTGLVTYDSMQSKNNLIADDESDIREYYVALRQFLREFMTGKFEWGIHKGIDYLKPNMFTGVTAVQIKDT